jgi:CDP-diacylglycerol--serine O-phosphatidyltransferase
MKKHIPNTITCLNLISGCIATYWALNGVWSLSLLFIIIGAVFDFFDGMSARLLGVSSPIGKELDSLADDITFGFAPSAIIFDYLQKSLAVGALTSAADASFAAYIHDLLPYVAFVMAAFSALRLAKFNLDERQAMGFIGLPTPANALFWGALLVGGGEWLVASPIWCWAVLGGMLVSCWLLVSEVPMFALKFKHWGWQGNEIRYVFLLSCVPLLALFGVPGIAIIIAWYVLLSVAIHLFAMKE